ncbi:hypothetical protein ACHQM5_011143 [Ranunculus cassubicifolius]
MCREEVETTEHLFLHCKKAQKMWNYFMAAFGEPEFSDGVMNLEMIFKLKLNNGMANEVGKLFWDTLKHAVLWVIWMERNRRIFEGIKMPTWRLINVVMDLLWRWNLSKGVVRRLLIKDVMCRFYNVIRL